MLLLRAVELFHALAGLLVAQAHAVQELLHPPLAGTHVESLRVEPFEHQASNRHSAEAQDVGHSQDVLAQPCHVGSAALRRPGTPGAPVKTTLRKCYVTNIGSKHEYSGKQQKTTCDETPSRRQPVPVKRNTTTRRKKSSETRGTHEARVDIMSTPATFKSFGNPLQATSPFPLHAVHLITKVALPVDV